MSADDLVARRRRSRVRQAAVDAHVRRVWADHVPPEGEIAYEHWLERQLRAEPEPPAQRLGAYARRKEST